MKTEPLPPAAASHAPEEAQAPAPIFGRRCLRFLIPIVYSTIIGYFLFHYREDWRLLRGLSISQASGLTVLAVLSIAINSLKLQRILLAHGILLQAKEAFGLASISSALNSLIFKSGALVVSSHLKRRHGFPYSRFIGTLGADHLIMMFINAVSGGCVSLYVTLILGKPFAWAAAAFFGIGAILFLMQRGTFEFKAGVSRLSQAIRQALDSLRGLLKNRTLFRALCAYNFTLLLTGSLRLYLACTVIGMEVTVVSCILFTTSMAFVRVLPLLQSDLGSRELTVGFLSGLLGTGFKAGLIATVIDRFFELSTAFVLAFIFRDLLLAAKQATPQDDTHPIPNAHP